MMEKPKLPPSSGFLKVDLGAPAKVSGADRATLIRRGNEFFNQGRYDLAKRVFITARYGDGLIRLGDKHLQQNEPLEALRLYQIAPEPSKAADLIERFADIVRQWLEEDE